MTHFVSSSLIHVLSRSALVIGTAVLLLAFGGESKKGEGASGSEVTANDTVETVVEVTMTDHAFEPSNVTVPAGEPVTIEFENAGTVEHYFVVGDTIASDGDGVRENLFRGVSLEKSKESGGHEEEREEEHEEEEGHENEFELPPGGRGSITFTLPDSKAGTYTIACFETTGGKTHHELGMRGTLVVTASEN